jgi:hypothetical protein
MRQEIEGKYVNQAMGNRWPPHISQMVSQGTGELAPLRTSPKCPFWNTRASNFSSLTSHVQSVTKGHSCMSPSLFSCSPLASIIPIQTKGLMLWATGTALKSPCSEPTLPPLPWQSVCLHPLCFGWDLKTVVEIFSTTVLRDHPKVTLGKTGQLLLALLAFSDATSACIQIIKPHSVESQWESNLSFW